MNKRMSETGTNLTSFCVRANNVNFACKLLSTQVTKTKLEQNRTG